MEMVALRNGSSTSRNDASGVLRDVAIVAFCLPYEPR